jgi:hypothetical protein
MLICPRSNSCNVEMDVCVQRLEAAQEKLACIESESGKPSLFPKKTGSVTSRDTTGNGRENVVVGGFFTSRSILSSLGLDTQP